MRRYPISYLAIATAGVMLSVVQSGCSSLAKTCDTSNDANPPQTYTGGRVEGGVYMSSLWTGPLLSFAAGKRYDLVHGLGCIPRDIAVWVAFNENGTSEGANAIAPSAGNMSVVQVVSDQYIRIKNDTCGQYFVLVTAGGCVASASDAGLAQDATAQDASATDTESDVVAID